MFHIILFEPEIPPNAGNIIRLSVNTGCNLHFIEPLGFTLDEKGFKRAGMDYMKKINFNIWDNLESCIKNIKLKNIYSISTKGNTRYSDINFEKNDAFIFGPESRGLPLNIREKYNSLHIPMNKNGRSLNLANAVSIIIYEAWRKINFQ
jgi:tRNA (cytidine/uridine-2'-O-)-methyltransferase